MTAFLASNNGASKSAPSAAIGSFVSAAVFSCWYLLLSAGSLCLAEFTTSGPA